MKPNVTIEGLRKTGFKVMVIHSMDVTTIYVTDLHGNTARGQSICHEDENYNRKLGNKIALGRAIKNLTMGEVIPNFDPKKTIM
jgi:hypothetical protein